MAGRKGGRDGHEVRADTNIQRRWSKLSSGLVQNDEFLDDRMENPLYVLCGDELLL